MAVEYVPDYDETGVDQGGYTETVPDCGPPKEEPDCFTCGDDGCLDCGRVDTSNPDHLRAVAARLLQGRNPVVDRSVSDEDLAGLPAEAAAAIRELVATAEVHTEIRWRDPSEYSAESPF